jgi:hypothetical protein
MSRRLDFVLVIGCLTSFTITSCHKKNDRDGIKPETDAALSEIRWLELEDPDCVTNDNHKSVATETATTYQWDGTSVQQLPVPLAGAWGTESEFQSKNIIGTLLNLGKSYDCKFDSSGERTCTPRDGKKTEAQVLKLCRSSMQYQRDSLESVAITSHAIVEDAYNFYGTIENTVPGLAKSIMVIQPRFERKYTKKSGDILTKYDADNAAFTSMELGTPARKYGLMLIYPSKKTSFEESGVNLWEVPFVLKHEFGHHVFHHYVKDTDHEDSLTISTSGNTLHDMSGILPSEKSRIPRHQGFNLTTNATAAMAGINETFADLFAYFAQESTPNQVTGIKCLDTSRDPKSAKTRAGLVKQLSKRYVDMYEGRLSALDSDDCGEPSFDDSHDIAMVMGYPLAKFIERAEPSGKGKDRAKHLINWAKEIQRLTDQSTSNISLDTLVGALVSSIKPNITANDFTEACSELVPKITGLPLSTAACK